MTTYPSSIKGIKCPACSLEWTALLESGVCVDCAAKAGAEAERRTRLGEQLTRLLGRKGMEEFTYKRFKPSALNRAGLAACEKFDPGEQNLYLWGPCGSGKTHLAYALARFFIEKGMRVMVIKQTDLMRKFRKKDAQDEEAELARFAAYDVLVIDDLGVGKSTEFANQILYEIVDRRIMNYKNGLVVTSNLSMDMIASKMEDSRLSDRLAGICEYVKVDTERSHRLDFKSQAAGD